MNIKLTPKQEKDLVQAGWDPNQLPLADWALEQKILAETTLNLYRLDEERASLRKQVSRLHNERAALRKTKKRLDYEKALLFKEWEKLKSENHRLMKVLEATGNLGKIL